MFGYSKKMIRKGKEFRRNLPLNLLPENIDHFSANIKYKSPDLFLYFFLSASFLPDSTLFLFRIWPLNLSFPYYKKRIKLHSIKGIVDIQQGWYKIVIEKKKEPYLIIHDQWTLNYYHWMTQALPRLLMVLKTEVPFTLLLPKTHCLEFHVMSLKFLGVENWISFETDKTYFEVDNLIYPSHDLQIGDYHDDLMMELSTALRRGIGVALKRNYVYIQRASKGTRRIINEGEVLDAFTLWGFKVISFENMNFEEQQAVAGNASILAGVHGAGLSNMLYMEKGSKVLELVSVLNGEQYYYYSLSNALGHDYYYQLCKQEDNRSIQEANLYVDILELNKNIELMVKQNHG
jgi:capsular polysaccharide biosynthesis protein